MSSFGSTSKHQVIRTVNPEPKHKHKLSASESNWLGNAKRRRLSKLPNHHQEESFFNSFNKTAACTKSNKTEHRNKRNRSESDDNSERMVKKRVPGNPGNNGRAVVSLMRTSEKYLAKVLKEKSSVLSKQIRPQQKHSKPDECTSTMEEVRSTKVLPASNNFIRLDKCASTMEEVGCTKVLPASNNFICLDESTTAFDKFDAGKNQFCMWDGILKRVFAHPYHDERFSIANTKELFRLMHPKIIIKPVSPHSESSAKSISKQPDTCRTEPKRHGNSDSSFKKQTEEHSLTFSPDSHHASLDEANYVHPSEELNRLPAAEVSVDQLHVIGESVSQIKGVAIISGERENLHSHVESPQSNSDTVVECTLNQNVISNSCDVESDSPSDTLSSDSSCINTSVDNLAAHEKTDSTLEKHVERVSVSSSTNTTAISEASISSGAAMDESERLFDVVHLVSKEDHNHSENLQTNLNELDRTSQNVNVIRNSSVKKTSSQCDISSPDSSCVDFTMKEPVVNEENDCTTGKQHEELTSHKTGISTSTDLNEAVDGIDNSSKEDLHCHSESLETDSNFTGELVQGAYDISNSVAADINSQYHNLSPDSSCISLSLDEPAKNKENDSTIRKEYEELPSHETDISTPTDLNEAVNQVDGIDSSSKEDHHHHRESPETVSNDVGDISNSTAAEIGSQCDILSPDSSCNDTRLNETTVKEENNSKLEKHVIKDLLFSSGETNISFLTGVGLSENQHIVADIDSKEDRHSYSKNLQINLYEQDKFFEDANSSSEIYSPCNTRSSDSLCIGIPLDESAVHGENDSMPITCADKEFLPSSSTVLTPINEADESCQAFVDNIDQVSEDLHKPEEDFQTNLLGSAPQDANVISKSSSEINSNCVAFSSDTFYTDNPLNKSADPGEDDSTLEKLDVNEFLVLSGSSISSGTDIDESERQFDVIDHGSKERYNHSENIQKNLSALECASQDENVTRNSSVQEIDNQTRSSDSLYIGVGLDDTVVHGEHDNTTEKHVEEMMFSSSAIPTALEPHETAIASQANVDNSGTLPDELHGGSKHDLHTHSESPQRGSNEAEELSQDEDVISNSIIPGIHSPNDTSSSNSFCVHPTVSFELEILSEKSSKYAATGAFHTSLSEADEMDDHSLKQSLNNFIDNSCTFGNQTEEKEVCSIDADEPSDSGYTFENQTEEVEVCSIDADEPSDSCYTLGNQTEVEVCTIDADEPSDSGYTFGKQAEEVEVCSIDADEPSDSGYTLGNQTEEVGVCSIDADEPSDSCHTLRNQTEVEVCSIDVNEPSDSGYTLGNQTEEAEVCSIDADEPSDSGYTFGNQAEELEVCSIDADEPSDSGYTFGNQAEEVEVCSIDADEPSDSGLFIGTNENVSSKVLPHSDSNCDGQLLKSGSDVSIISQSVQYDSVFNHSSRSLELLTDVTKSIVAESDSYVRNKSPDLMQKLSDSETDLACLTTKLFSEDVQVELLDYQEAVLLDEKRDLKEKHSSDEQLAFETTKSETAAVLDGCCSVVEVHDRMSTEDNQSEDSANSDILDVTHEEETDELLRENLWVELDALSCESEQESDESEEETTECLFQDDQGNFIIFEFVKCTDSSNHPNHFGSKVLEYGGEELWEAEDEKRESRDSLEQGIVGVVNDMLNMFSVESMDAVRVESAQCDVQNNISSECECDMSVHVMSEQINAPDASTKTNAAAEGLSVSHGSKSNKCVTSHHDSTGPLPDVRETNVSSLCVLSVPVTESPTVNSLEHANSSCSRMSDDWTLSRQKESFSAPTHLNEISNVRDSICSNNDQTNSSNQRAAELSVQETAVSFDIPVRIRVLECADVEGFEPSLEEAVTQLIGELVHQVGSAADSQKSDADLKECVNEIIAAVEYVHSLTSDCIAIVCGIDKDEYAVRETVHFLCLKVSEALGIASEKSKESSRKIYRLVKKKMSNCSPEQVNSVWHCINTRSIPIPNKKNDKLNGYNRNKVLLFNKWDDEKLLKRSTKNGVLTDKRHSFQQTGSSLTEIGDARKILGKDLPSDKLIEGRVKKLLQNGLARKSFPCNGTPPSQIGEAYKLVKFIDKKKNEMMKQLLNNILKSKGQDFPFTGTSLTEIGEACKLFNNISKKVCRLAERSKRCKGQFPNSSNSVTDSSSIQVLECEDIGPPVTQQSDVWLVDEPLHHNDSNAAELKPAQTVEEFITEMIASVEFAHSSTLKDVRDDKDDDLVERDAVHNLCLCVSEASRRDSEMNSQKDGNIRQVKQNSMGNCEMKQTNCSGSFQHYINSLKKYSDGTDLNERLALFLMNYNPREPFRRSRNHVLERTEEKGSQFPSPWSLKALKSDIVSKLNEKSGEPKAQFPNGNSVPGYNPAHCSREVHPNGALQRRTKTCNLSQYTCINGFQTKTCDSSDAVSLQNGLQTNGEESSNRTQRSHLTLKQCALSSKRTGTVDTSFGIYSDDNS